MLEVYSYRESFIIELTYCPVCNTYYSKASEPEHTCQTQSSQKEEKIDVMQTMDDNLKKK